MELARRGFAALARGDIDVIADLLAEDVLWHAGDPSAEGTCHNRRQALDWINRPDRQGPGELLEVIDAGDRVVVILQPPPIDGMPSPPRGQITTFRDGKVIEMRGFATVESALEAAGLPIER